MNSDVGKRRVVLALRSQDIQTGLQEYRIDEFEVLLRIGMATRLAIHLRGGDIADYGRLKEVSSVLFGIEKLVYPSIVTLLEDIEFVKVIGTGSSRKIVPTVPYFDDLYQTLGEKAEVDGLNELEVASINVLDRLSTTPLRRESVQKALNIDSGTLDSAIKIGKEGSYLDEIRRREGSILVSPVYFTENSTSFASIVAKYGDPAFKRVFDLLRRNPGWPLSKILAESAIGETHLDSDEQEVFGALVQGGLLQPPAITTAMSGTNHFLFTPPIGTKQIQVVEKEIYEKAMAVISCVRQGEHFARWSIRNPRLVINALLRDGYLRPNTEAREQYRTLVIKKIAKLDPPGAAWQRVVLVDIPENRKALQIALDLLTHSELLTDRGVARGSKELIFSDRDYSEYLRGYGLVRRTKIVPQTPVEKQAAAESLIEAIQKGG
jgi:hypothetical protein